MKNKKTYHQIDTRPLAIGAIFFFISAIMLSIILSLTGKNGAGKKVFANNEEVFVTQSPEELGAQKYDLDIRAVILEVDTQKQQIQLVNADTDDEVWVNYNGGTNIRDKYGKIIAASQLNKGELAEVSYNGVSGKLKSLTINSKGWESKGITKLLVNTEMGMLSFLGNRYTYSKGLVILNEGKKVNLSDLVSSDVLTIRGYGEKICSIIVTKGHGYIKLAEDESFIGGTIYVGTKLSQQIFEGMQITVPEGTYEVTVENGSYKGTEKILIERGRVSTFRVDAYGPQGVQKGRVTFRIQPENAVLYIDDKLTYFAEPVELTYGQHKIEVALGGYHTYSNHIEVDKTENIVTVILSENTNGGADITLTPAPDNNLDNDNFDENNGNGNNNNNNQGEDETENNNKEDEEDNINDNEMNNDDNTNNDNTSEVEDETDDNFDDSDENEDETDNNTTDDDSSSDDDSSDNDSSDGTANKKKIDENHTLTIRCTSGTQVYIDGDYVGTITNGSLVLPKYLGVMEIELLYNGLTKNYYVDVANDKDNTVYNFPNF